MYRKLKNIRDMTKKTDPKRKTIGETLLAMRIGQTIDFPVEQVASVRGIASTWGLRYDRKYYTHYSKIRKVIEVYRER